MNKKRCCSCNQDKELSEFNKNRSRSDGLQPQCKTCARETNKKSYAKNTEAHRERNRNYHSNNREKLNKKKRKYVVKYKYGLTPEQELEILKLQENKCANPRCRKELTNTKHTHIDHCHSTGKVRGILCRECNLALGFVFDNPELLQGLIEYLNRNNPEILV
jgi:hypothetical protein